MNKPCPCQGCTERFIACSGRCPKDKRGEYGYKAWRADCEEEKRVNALRKSIDFTASKSRATWHRNKLEDSNVRRYR